jgi:hypothetical protein
MIGLIITILIGIAIAYLSRQNSLPIVTTIGNNTYFSIPLYVITLGTYILGILIAWIIEIPQTISTALQITGLGRSIKSGNNTIVDLQNKLRKLEIDNVKLQERNQSIIASKRIDGNYKPNIFQNILNKINHR